MTARAVLILSFLLLGAGCASSSPEVTNVTESITLTTSDNVSIASDFYASDGDLYAILLHMMPAAKESWHDFATALQGKGISSIAIDERGHGQSQDGPNGYKEFSDEQQATKQLDVQAAWEELKRRGATPEKTVVVGASIGANLSIQFLSEQSKIPAAVALSPGLDYRSVAIEKFVTQGLQSNQKLLLIASDEDEYSFLSIKKLHELNSDQTIFWPQENLGHGTTMFENDSALIGKVIDWIKEQL